MRALPCPPAHAHTLRDRACVHVCVCVFVRVRAYSCVFSACVLTPHALWQKYNTPGTTHAHTHTHACTWHMRAQQAPAGRADRRTLRLLPIRVLGQGRLRKAGHAREPDRQRYTHARTHVWHSCCHAHVHVRASSGIEAWARKSSGIEASARARPIVFTRCALPLVRNMPLPWEKLCRWFNDALHCRWFMICHYLGEQVYMVRHSWWAGLLRGLSYLRGLLIRVRLCECMQVTSVRCTWARSSALWTRPRRTALCGTKTAASRSLSKHFLTVSPYAQGGDLS